MIWWQETHHRLVKQNVVMSWNIIPTATKNKVKNISYQAAVKMFISFFIVMLEIKQQQQRFFPYCFFYLQQQKAIE